MKFYITLFLLFFGALAFSVSAQVSTVKRVVNGKEYVVHTIQKGQTVYSITKMYGVTDKEIYAANPGAEAGIKAGAELLIPTKGGGKPADVVKDPVKDPVKPPVQTPQKYISHTVARSETLYGLSKQYGITVDDILKANPELSNGLKNGMVIKIPQGTDALPPTVENEPVKEDLKDEPDADLAEPVKPVTLVPEPNSKLKSQKDCLNNAAKKKEYTVALLLPFGGNASPENKQARVAFHFYAGILMAQKYYRPKDVSLNWKVYNTGESDDSVTVAALISSGKLDNADMIVGPLYASGVYPVASYAASRKIPMLSPTSRMAGILDGNPYLIKTTPSPESFLTGLAEYMTQRFDHIVLVEPAGSEDSLMMRALEAELQSIIKDSPGKSIAYVEAGKTSPMDMIKPTGKNLIYYPTKKELTVTNFLTGLRKLKNSDHVTIMGDESWLRFRNFDPDYYNNVRLHVPILHFSSPEIGELQPFVTRFRNEFKTDPEVYAFRGYDVACYVTDLLENYGNSLPECIRYQTSTYLLTPFKMLKKQGGGFDNKGISVLVIEDYQLRIETN